MTVGEKLKAIAISKKDFKKNLYFIILAYVISWIIWSFCFFSDEKLGNILRIAGTFAPSLSGLIITLINDKQDALKLLKSTINFKIKVIDYLYIFLTLPIIVVITYLIMLAGKIETPTPSFRIFELPLVFIYILVLMGPLGEEYGWRGFFQNRLLHKYNPFVTAIITGIIWSIWHLPLFFIKGALQNSLALYYGYALAFAGYMFYTVILTVFITIMFIRTKKSMLSAILIHTLANMSIGMMPLVFSKIGAIIQLSIMTIIIGLIMFLNRKILFNKID